MTKVTNTDAKELESTVRMMRLTMQELEKQICKLDKKTAEGPVPYYCVAKAEASFHHLCNALSTFEKINAYHIQYS